MKRKVDIHCDHCPEKWIFILTIFQVNELYWPVYFLPVLINFFSLPWTVVLGRGYFFELPRQNLLLSVFGKLMTQIILQYVGEMIHKNRLLVFDVISNPCIYKSILDRWFDTRRFGHDFWFHSQQRHRFPSLTDRFVLKTMWTETASIVTFAVPKSCLKAWILPYNRFSLFHLF